MCTLSKFYNNNNNDNNDYNNNNNNNERLLYCHYHWLLFIPISAFQQWLNVKNN